MSGRKTPMSPEKSTLPDLKSLSSLFLEPSAKIILKQDLVEKILIFKNKFFQQVIMEYLLICLRKNLTNY